jgi:L-threonylcarbamoyladenylate synthase
LFGLLADATTPNAIDRLLSQTPRGADNGPPLMVPTAAVWRTVVTEVPPMADRLARAFWPGRMTIVLPVREGAVDPRVVLDGTVAVRVPGISMAARVVEAFGGVLTATSANSPGEAPATTVAEVQAFFPEAAQSGQLRVLEGVAPGGAVSTIIAIRGGRYHIVRHGAVALEDLRHVADAEM